ncbi:uncharacterized protein LOC125807200 [Solanum verrucosum]|uniref:uncharacterized protein LOC125807200 n=1 Tax=Solanum verrucosum TaxID=315347 RepID=UPI0020D11E52|nr:uncharacterized protein LOC125807200 [Solanum verrucosum]
MGEIPAETTTSNTPIRLDFASPFYLHPSESASSTLLHVVFDGTSYRTWKRVVLRALFVKSKTRSINGKVVRPDPADPTFMQWKRYLGDKLQYVNNAKELWEELEVRYDQTNGCNLYQLQKEINDLVQGTLDVTSYYTKMKKLWEEMNTLDSIISVLVCVCVCDGKIKMHKAEKDRRLIHFLMGLIEMYSVIRGNILMLTTLPTMAQAFSILSRKERQREVKPLNHMALESTSLNASASPQHNVSLQQIQLTTTLILDNV